MNNFKVVVLVVGAFIGFSTYVKCAPEADRVTSLPGLDVQPTFNHYAGYLSASGTKHFFYWFVESEQNPSTDPVVLWLNGGPGCSSLTGLLAELGPWRTKPDGSGLVWFEQRWNKIANMIFMESPHCVGYSYADDEACTSSDDQTALDNHLALIDFFEKFPEYKNNDFYIAGESYAGVYVPTLSARIVDDSNFNFKQEMLESQKFDELILLGFAVGNSVTDSDIMGNGFTYFAWGRGLIGSDLWNDMLDNCCVERNSSNCQFYRSENLRCRTSYAKVYQTQWSLGLNPYSVYADCYGGAPDPRGVYSETADSAVVMLPEGLHMEPEEERRYSEFVRQLSDLKNVTVRIPCSYTDDREIYLNRPDVREALHVPENVQYWLPCSNIIYNKQYGTVINEYYKVLGKGHRILSYYGDFDMACDHLSGMWFIETLNTTLIEPFKQWLYPGDDGFNQIAGFVIQYDHLKYVSIKGAGHFTPTDKPVPSFIMFQRFLNDEPY